MSYVFFFFCDNSMVSFLIAFAFLCLQDSDVATRSVFAILCGIIMILTLWCIWTSWRNQESSNADKPKRTTLTFEEDRVKRKEKGFTFERMESLDSDSKSQLEEQPTKTEKKRPAARRSTTLSTALKLPFQKFGRSDSSKTEVDESTTIDENGNGSGNGKGKSSSYDI